MPTLTYYVGSSVDGFIAGPDGSIDVFPVGDDVLAYIVADYPETLPGHVRSAIGVDTENRHFDTVVMGRSTYQPALTAGITNPYPHLRQYVVSRELAASPDREVTIVRDPIALVRELKERDGAGIWLAGGGQLAGTLHDEIDELVVKVYPVLIGRGTPMFGDGFAPARLELRASKILTGGAVVLDYGRATG